MTFGIDKRMLKKGFISDQCDVSLTCRNVTKRTQEGPVVADRALVIGSMSGCSWRLRASSLYSMPVSSLAASDIIE